MEAVALLLTVTGRMRAKRSPFSEGQLRSSSRPAARLLSHQMAAAILLPAAGRVAGPNGCPSASLGNRAAERSPCPGHRTQGLDVDKGKHNSTVSRRGRQGTS